MKRALVASAVLLAVGLLLWGLSDALAPVLVALFLAYLLDPLVTRLEKRVSRTVGALVAVLLLCCAAAGLTLLTLPLLVREVGLLAERLPGYAWRVRDTVVPWIEDTFRVEVPDTFADLLGAFSQDARSLAQSIVGPLGRVVGRVLGTFGALVAGLAAAVIVPFLTFFFVRGFPRLRAFAQGLVPPAWRERTATVAREVDRAVASWLRGQVSVMLVQGVLYAIGLTLVGLDFGVLIGVLAGLLAFIPYAGVAVGLTLALLTSLVDFAGWGRVLGVVGVFAAVQTLDALVVTPRLVGQRTGLGPAGVVVALLVCGDLWGFTGVLLAVPIAASSVVVGKHLLEAYKRTDLFAIDAGKENADG